MNFELLASILAPFTELNSWHALANCDDPELMYDPKREHEARALCRRCAVRAECLAAALTRGEPDGVWGGLNADERGELEKADPKEIPALMHKFAQRWRSSGRRAS